MIDTRPDDHQMKFRHEMKYLCSDAELAMLKSRLNGIIQEDPHVGKTGTYIIRSLYFDDLDNRCYYENENGTCPREKFRIRIYNGSMERISLERKAKVVDKIRKTSCILTRENYEILTNPLADKTVREEYPELMKKLLAMYQIRRMEPKVIVEYERRPFVYKNGNVRITFDRNVISSRNIKSFSNQQIHGRLILPTGMQLLEVKYDQYLPDYIYRSLQLSDMRTTAFSKYYLCRKYAM